MSNLHTPIGASICIAAHNEERTIESTLRSVTHQIWDDRPNLEVLVCANGCTDQTAARVRRMQASVPFPLRVIETAQKGKPIAWNLLIEEAQFDYVFFVDADVEVDKGALARLLRELIQEPQIIAAAATNAAVLERCSLLTRLTRPPADDGIYIKQNQQFISGRLYAVRKPDLLAILKDSGFEKMPESLLHEDAWLQRILDTAAMRHKQISIDRLVKGDGRYWKVCHEALVYFVPHEWYEEPKIKARAMHARDQLREFFPEYYSALDDLRTHTPRTAEARIARIVTRIRRSGVRRAWRIVASELSRRWAIRQGHRIYRRNRANAVRVSAQHWIRSESSRADRESAIRA